MSEIKGDMEKNEALASNGEEPIAKIPAKEFIWPEDKPWSPEHKYMRDLLYDAKTWRDDDQPKFERISLLNLKTFLDDYLSTLTTRSNGE